ncbi:MAG: CBS domain-containing protein [Candidatus Bathyarchaeota archaeon]|nr:CBS domain-containing protein [Candidatus Bathyarchaeota archaeon]MDH5733218.1 CBS domain-containing protein [Candidatus Bathyarchaeota archaeon]
MLKKLRIEAGLTQRQLANLIGISQAHIAKIEKENVDPRLSTVNKILQVLTEDQGKRCGDIMTTKVISAKPEDTILKISQVMMNHAISQLPIIEDGKVIGTVTEESIIKNLSSNIAGEKVEEIMETPLPSVPENTNLSMIRPLLEDHYGVLVMRKGDVVGIITRSDLLKIISKPL